MWREGLGMYKILKENKNGYRNHPATKEFEGKIEQLWLRLHAVRQEMLKRGYNPKPLAAIRTDLLSGWDKGTSDNNEFGTIGLIDSHFEIEDWQSLPEQIKVLQSKHCACKL
jgi:hypothetical protein